MSARWIFVKTGRAGLGNELFPYLRGLERAAELQAEVAMPGWFKLRLGPYIRRERDKREYWRVFRVRSAQELMTRGRAQIRLVVGRSSQVEVVNGMTHYFSDLKQRPEWYREQLTLRLRPGATTTRIPGTYFAVHVRLGDFGRATTTAEWKTNNNVRTPLAWYQSALSALRATWPQVPILLASDGSDEELQPLLGHLGVRRSDAKNAIDDIWTLADAAAIIGSKSTFSAWGSFLGNTPLLLPEGGDVYKPNKLVAEWDEGAWPESWRDAVSERLRST